MNTTAILRRVQDAKRLEEILVVLVKYEMGMLVSKAKITHLLPFYYRFQKQKLQQYALSPENLLKIFEELGGSFLKLSQLLSLRPDLLPQEYCDALSHLQDTTTPVPFEEINRILKDELKERYHQILHIERKPLASASIGQVHRAKLRDGQDVVLKIQRPHVEKAFAADLDILEKFAQVLSYHYPESSVDFTNIYAAFKEYTQQEFDYRIEAEHLDAMHLALGSNPSLLLPSVVHSLTTKKVLTMTYVEGKPLRSLADQPLPYRKKMLTLFLEQILTQIMEHGIFHADPHPGNVFYKGNAILYLDFGIVGYLSTSDRRVLQKLFLAVMQKDTALLTKLLIKVGIASQEVNQHDLELDLKRYLGKYYDTSIEHLRMKELFSTLFMLMKKHHLQIPQNVVLLGKCLMTTESVITTLDPSFNLIRALQQYAKRLQHQQATVSLSFKNSMVSLLKMKDFLSTLPDQAEDVSYKIEQVNQNAKAIDTDLKQLTKTIDRSEKTIAFAILFFGFLAVGYLLGGAFAWIFYSIGVLFLILLLYTLLKR